MYGVALAILVLFFVVVGIHLENKRAYLVRNGHKKGISPSKGLFDYLFTHNE